MKYILNERLYNFYLSLKKAFPTAEFSNIFEDSMAFAIDYVDIDEISLLPIIKASMDYNVNVSELYASVKGDKKYLIGAVQLKDVAKEKLKDLDIASLESEE